MSRYDIIGKVQLQHHFAQIFKSKMTGHAYLLEGPKGTGKKTIGRNFALALLCNSPQNGLACGYCEHCKMIQAGGMGEIHILEGEKSIAVDDIRQMQRNVQMLPINSEKKAYLIVDGEKMTPQAQNALLKTLEEPPSYCVIIITTFDTQRLLETIRSRSVTIPMGINTPEEIIGFISKKNQYADEDIRFAAYYAQGSIGKALRFLENEKGLEKREKVFSYIKALINKKVGESMRCMDELQKDKDQDFLEIIVTFIKDMLLYEETRNGSNLINSDKKDIIMDGVNRYHKNTLTRIAFHTFEAMKKLEMNASYQLTLDAMNIKMLEELSK